MKPDLIQYYQRLTDREFFLAGRFILFIWLIKVLFYDAELAAAYPDSLLIPTGLFTIVNSDLFEFFFSYRALMGLKVLLIVVLSAFIWKIRSSWLGLCTVILLLIFSNVNHSYGNFLNHAEVALYASLIIFATVLFFRNPLDDRYAAQHIILFFSLSAIVLTVCYAQIGIYRLIHGGWDIYVKDYMAMTVMERSLQRVDYFFSSAVNLAPYEWFRALMNIGFALTTVFEVLSPLIIIFKRFRQIWLAVMIPFHFSTLLLMNIFFWENILLILLLFTGLLKIISQLPDKKKALQDYKGISGKAF